MLGTIRLVPSKVSAAIALSIAAIAILSSSFLIFAHTPKAPKSLLK